MSDIASLGIKVTSSGVKEATRDLAKLEKQGKETERTAKRVGSAWGKALGTAVAGGVVVAGFALKKYITNTIEAEQVQAQLAARIKSTGQAAGLAIGDLNKMAAALQFKTSFDDEAIGGAQALLLTFTRIGKDVFPRATEAVLDMSTALGTDLNSAALQVGKALNDPVKGLTALSRAGVQFSAAQKDIIEKLVETGRTADAQKLILKELETQMGGAAVAARNTLGGALKALGNSFNNLLEGDAGDGGVKGTRDAIELLNRTINDPGIKRGVDSMASGILTVASAAIQLIAALGNAGSAVSEFFASNERKSKAALQNKKNELETKLFKTQRRSGQGFSDANDPISKLFGLPSGKSEKIAALKKEIAEIDSLQKASAKASMFRGVVGNYQNNIAAAKLGGGGGGGKSDKTGKSKTLRELPDFSKDAADALRDLIEQEHRATEAYRDLAATLAGPLAEAERDHVKRVDEINDYASKSAEAAAGKDALLRDEAVRYKEVTDEISARRTPAQQMLEDMQFEIMLLGKTRDEQDLLTAARQLGAAAMTEQGKAAIAAMADYQKLSKAAAEQAAFMDDLKVGISDMFVDFVSGAKSAKEAFGDFADALFARALQFVADKAIQALFDAFSNKGKTGAAQGAGGGGWAGLFSSLLSAFGGGSANGNAFANGRQVQAFATGGVVSSPTMFGMAGGRFGVMGEAGPEAILPLHRGPDGKLGVRVAANDDAPRSRVVNNNTTFVLPQTTTPQTQAQVAQGQQRAATRATSRNR